MGRGVLRTFAKRRLDMTFLQYVKQKKGIDPEGKDLNELMNEYYDDYLMYLRGVKDGCGPKV